MESEDTKNWINMPLALADLSEMAARGRCPTPSGPRRTPSCGASTRRAASRSGPTRTPTSERPRWPRRKPFWGQGPWGFWEAIRQSLGWDVVPVVRNRQRALFFGEPEAHITLLGGLFACLRLVLDCITWRDWHRITCSVWGVWGSQVALRQLRAGALRCAPTWAGAHAWRGPRADEPLRAQRRPRGRLLSSSYGLKASGVQIQDYEAF